MADMGKTEIDAVSLESISAFIQAELKQKSVLYPTVQQFAAPAGADMIKIPRAGGFTSESKAENTSLTAQVLTFATDDLLLDKHEAVLTRLEDFANLQASPNVVEEILKRMASEIAYAIDTDVVACLEATSASAPDHRIAYADATSLKKADVLEAKKLLAIQNVPFAECFMAISPASEASLLAVDDFVHADKYGSSQAVMNGELGRLYGCRVIISNQIADAKTIVYHPTHVAFAMQQSLSFETQRDLPNVATEYLAHQVYGCKTLDSGKRGVMLGTAS